MVVGKCASSLNGALGLLQVVGVCGSGEGRNGRVGCVVLGKRPFLCDQLIMFVGWGPDVLPTFALSA